MRTIPAGLAAELASRSHATCRIVTITRKDGVIVRFAEHQATLSVGGQSYPAVRGVRMASIPFVLNATFNSVDFEVAAEDGGTIDPDDLRAGAYDNALVLISLCSFANPGNGKVDLFRGTIGEIELTDRGLAKFEVIGPMSVTRDVVIEKYSPYCRAHYGDARCKIDLAPLTLTRTITAISGFDITLSSAVGATYKLGQLRKSGSDEGYEIRAVSGSTVSGYLPVPSRLQVGDTVLLVPGCDYTLDGAQGCVVKGNAVNFRGEPFVPGGDAVTINPTGEPPSAPDPGGGSGGSGGGTSAQWLIVSVIATVFGGPEGSTCVSAESGSFANNFIESTTGTHWYYFDLRALSLDIGATEGTIDLTALAPAGGALSWDFARYSGGTITVSGVNTYNCDGARIGYTADYGSTDQDIADTYHWSV